MAYLRLDIQQLHMRPTLLHNKCPTSLEKLPGIGKFPGFMVPMVIHSGKVQEGTGLRLWHTKSCQVPDAILSDCLVSVTAVQFVSLLWLGLLGSLANITDAHAGAC